VVVPGETCVRAEFACILEVFIVPIAVVPEEFLAPSVDVLEEFSVPEAVPEEVFVHIEGPDKVSIFVRLLLE